MKIQPSPFLNSRWVYLAAAYPAIATIPYWFYTDRYNSLSRFAFVFGCAFGTGILLHLGLSSRWVGVRRGIARFTFWILMGLGLLYAGSMYFFAYEMRVKNAMGITSDLGIFEQVLWAGSHGYPFYSSPNYGTYLAGHFALYLLPLTAVYKILPDTGTIFAVQSLFTATAGILLYLLARTRLGKLPSLLIVFAFWLNPTTTSMQFAAYNNHFAPALWFAACAAYIKNRFGLFVVCCLLAASIQEDVALSLLVFALLAWHDKRSTVWRAFTFAFPLVWFLIAMLVIQNASAQTGVTLGGNFADLGQTPHEILSNLAAHPYIPVQKYLENAPAKGLWAYELLSPFLFILPFFHLIVLAGLPDWLVFTFIPRPPEFYSVGLYYSVLISAILFSASTLGLSSIRKRSLHFSGERFATTAATLFVGTNLVMLPLVVAPEMFTTRDPGRVAAIAHIQYLIEPDDCVAATYDIAATFAKRFEFYIVGVVREPVLLSCENIVVSNKALIGDSGAQKAIEKIELSGDYSQEFSADGLRLYKRR